MEALVLMNCIVSILVGGVVIFLGFDLRKVHNWLFLFYEFLSSFFLGFLYMGGVSGGLQLGAIFTLTFFLGGVVTRGQRQYAMKLLESNREVNRHFHSFVSAWRTHISPYIWLIVLVLAILAIAGEVIFRSGFIILFVGFVWDIVLVYLDRQLKKVGDK